MVRIEKAISHPRHSRSPEEVEGTIHALCCIAGTIFAAQQNMTVLLDEGFGELGNVLMEALYQYKERHSSN